MTQDLRFAYLLPTGRCNLACEGCYATLEHFGRHSKRGELSTERYKQVIRECVALGATCFDISGGEPFLRQDLTELCREIKRHENTRIWLVNNGTLATRERLQELQPYVERFVVSLDAADAELHDQIRGMNGGFHRGMQTLRRARSLGFPEVGVNFLLMRKNRNQVPKLFTMCRDEEFDRLSLLSFRDVSENDVFYDQMPSIDEMSVFWQYAVDSLEENEFPRFVDIVVPAFLHPEAMAFYRRLPSHIRARLTFHFPNLRGYSLFRTTLVVKPFGTVTGDTSMINDMDFDIGPAALGLCELWTAGSARWRSLLKEREKVLRANEPCNTCPRWHVCRGGCPAAAKRQWGDFQKYDRTCDKFRQEHAF